MLKTLYLECASGISGDMFVAAMLDLGASEEKLRTALESLPIDGFKIEISRVNKAGLDCCDFNVVLDAAHDGHDHDMEYLHGHSHEHAHDAGHAHDHRHEERGHGHSHDHAHAAETREENVVACEHSCGHVRAHHHEHRGMPEIEAIIDAAEITEGARELAKRIFGYIARAEAKAHGVPYDQVHFHEVGAVDSIVDVVAAAVCFDDLGISECVVERLCEGHGAVRCQHGVLPVPVPAAANICSEAGLPISIVDVEDELVTPTGAAIAAAVRTASNLPERFTVAAMGLGAGKRSYSRPSLLRTMIVEPVGQHASSPCAPHMWKLETEMDDCTGEALGFLMGELKAAGAFEVHYLPVFMKKNRPGYQIQALCKEPNIPAVEAALFAHSTTIGVRRGPVWRTALEREIRELQTPYGTARAKFVTLSDGSLRGYPEHDDVAKLARDAHAGYQDVRRAVLAAIDAQLR